MNTRMCKNTSKDTSSIPGQDATPEVTEANIAQSVPETSHHTLLPTTTTTLHTSTMNPAATTTTTTNAAAAAAATPYPYDIHKQRCTEEHWNHLHTSLANSHKRNEILAGSLHRLKCEEATLLYLAQQAEQQRMFVQSQRDMMAKQIEMIERQEEEVKVRERKCLVEKRKRLGIQVFYENDEKKLKRFCECVQLASKSLDRNSSISSCSSSNDDPKMALSESLEANDLRDLVACIFPKKSKFKRALKSNEETKKHPNVYTMFIPNNPAPPLNWEVLTGPNHLIPSLLPHDFPVELSFQALSTYAVIRTFSLQLLVSPFSPTVFLRALCLKMPSSLMNEVHVALLRLLFANIQDKDLHKKKGKIVSPYTVSNPLFPGLEQRDWRCLDSMTWPLFLCDYADMKTYQFEEESYVYMAGDVSLSGSQEDDDENIFEEVAIDDDDSIVASDSDDIGSHRQGLRTSKRLRKGAMYTEKLKRPKTCVNDEDEPKSKNKGKDVATPMTLSSAIPKTVIYEGNSPSLDQGSQAMMDRNAPLTNSCGHNNDPISVSHADTISQLRKRSYHLFTVDQKLTILEFLVDELLQTGAIISELDKRESHVNTDNYNQFHNGPSPNDLKSIVNVDQCVACGEEGELICCDGCVNSYHRKCASLPLHRELPGQWICPECHIPDPSKYGSLDGGAKSCMEWFSISDLSNLRHATDKCQQTLRSKYNNVLFIIVGGYVFKKVKDSNELPGCCIEYSNPPIPLSQKELFSLLKELGLDVCSQWPWSQIQFNPLVIFPELAKTALSPEHQFFKSQATLYYRSHVTNPTYFNPLAYSNSYRNAQYPTEANILPKNLGWNGTLDLGLLSFDPSYCLSLFTCTNSKDDLAICKNYFFEYIKPVKDYLIRLEHSLSKAYLLAEDWGINEDKNTWSTKVKDAQSVMRLAQLLRELICSTNSRAFKDAWNRSDSDKIRDYGCNPVQNNRNQFISFKNSSHSLELEIADRVWLRKINPLTKERQQGNMHQQIGRKGKIKLNPCTNTGLKPDPPPSLTNASSDFVPQDQSYTEVVTAPEENRNRRRSSRAKSSPSSNGVFNPILRLKNDDSIFKIEFSNKRERLNQFRHLLDKAFEKQMHWQICGRKPYPPKGTLPRFLTKTIARRGGIIYAPRMFYSPKHEVVQPSLAQNWMDDIKRCTTVPEFVVQLYELEENLDKKVIEACESICHKLTTSRNNGYTMIRQCIRSELTGLIEYFVYNKNHDKGYWVTENNIDLNILLRYRYDRSQLRKNIQRNEAKNKCENEIETANLLNAKQHRKTALQSIDISLRKTLELVENAQGKVRLKKDEISTKLRSLADENIAIEKLNTDIKRLNHPNARPSKDQLRNMAAYVTAKLDFTFETHRTKTLQILRETSTSGMSTVSHETINKARTKTLARLRQLNVEINSLFGSEREIPHSSLMKKLSESEKTAQQEFQKEVMSKQRQNKVVVNCNALNRQHSFHSTNSHASVCQEVPSDGQHQESIQYQHYQGISNGTYSTQQQHFAPPTDSHSSKTQNKSSSLTTEAQKVLNPE